MGTLTDVQLRGWVRAGKPIIGKSDGGGLTFTLSKNGTAAWVLRYRYAGRRKELTLGNYPGVSLSEARIKAGEARARVSDGEDVATERRRQKNQLLASGLVRELAADYLVRAAQDLAPRTLSETRRMLGKDVVPRIGGMMARDVTGADIVRVVEKVAERSQLVARRVFEVMSVLFAHGVAKHVVPANPCAGIKVSGTKSIASSLAEFKSSMAVSLGTMSGNAARGANASHPPSQHQHDDDDQYDADDTDAVVAIAIAIAADIAAEAAQKRDDKQDDEDSA